MKPLPARVYVMTHNEKEDGGHECLLTYQDDAPDDERELWRGIGLTFREACDAVWRAFWKWRDSTDPEKEADAEGEKG